MPQAIADDRLRRLYNYWDGLRGSRICPSRREVDPIDIRFILGSLSLIDVLDCGADFRIRLHGTELARRSGRELTGMRVSDLPDDGFRQGAVAAFRQVAEMREPVRLRSERLLDNRPVPFECLVLPLSDDALTVDTLLNALVYGD